MKCRCTFKAGATCLQEVIKTGDVLYFEGLISSNCYAKTVAIQIEDSHSFVKHKQAFRPSCEQNEYRTQKQVSQVISLLFIIKKNSIFDTNPPKHSIGFG